MPGYPIDPRQQQQQGYAYSQVNPSNTYVPRPMMQQYRPQSYVDQYDMQTAFAMVPGQQVPIPGGGGGGGGQPIIPPDTGRAGGGNPIVPGGYTGSEYVDGDSYDDQFDPGAGGAPSGGYERNQEAIDRAEGVGGGEEEGAPFIADVARGLPAMRAGIHATGNVAGPPIKRYRATGSARADALDDLKTRGRTARSSRVGAVSATETAADAEKAKAKADADAKKKAAKAKAAQAKVKKLEEFARKAREAEARNKASAARAKTPTSRQAFKKAEAAAAAKAKAAEAKAAAAAKAAQQARNASAASGEAQASARSTASSASRTAGSATDEAVEAGAGAYRSGRRNVEAGKAYQHDPIRRAAKAIPQPVRKVASAAGNVASRVANNPIVNNPATRFAARGANKVAPFLTPLDMYMGLPDVDGQHLPGTSGQARYEAQQGRFDTADSPRDYLHANAMELWEHPYEMIPFYPQAGEWDPYGNLQQGNVIGALHDVVQSPAQLAQFGAEQLENAIPEPLAFWR